MKDFVAMEDRVLSWCAWMFLCVCVSERERERERERADKIGILQGSRSPGPNNALCYA